MKAEKKVKEKEEKEAAAAAEKKPDAAKEEKADEEAADPTVRIQAVPSITWGIYINRNGIYRISMHGNIPLFILVSNVSSFNLKVTSAAAFDIFRCNSISS